MFQGTRNIRAFRTTFQNGYRSFEEKEEDGRGGVGCSSIRSLAHNVHSTVKRMHKEGYGTVGINFTPFHNVDCPNGLSPRLCSPLTAEEQVEFWEHFFDEE